MNQLGQLDHLFSSFVLYSIFTNDTTHKTKCQALVSYSVLSIFGSFCKIFSDALRVRTEDPLPPGYCPMTRITQTTEQIAKCHVLVCWREALQSDIRDKTQVVPRIWNPSSTVSAEIIERQVMLISGAKKFLQPRVFKLQKRNNNRN